MTFFLEERRKDIFEWILQKGRVSVSELSDHYGVSEVTIRNDLQALEDQQLILRTHGGAIPGSSGFSVGEVIGTSITSISHWAAGVDIAGASPPAPAPPAPPRKVVQNVLQKRLTYNIRTWIRSTFWGPPEAGVRGGAPSGAATHRESG